MFGIDPATFDVLWKAAISIIGTITAVVTYFQQQKLKDHADQLKK